VEEGRITYFPRRLQNGYTDDELKSYLEEGDQDTRAPDSFGLTQACRQIRAEYSPIYAAEATIRIFHLDLPEFMNSHFPHMARDEEANVVGNLILECKPIAVNTKEKDNLREVDVDILSLLEYCKSRPGL
jgi:hypothetical protein